MHIWGPTSGNFHVHLGLYCWKRACWTLSLINSLIYRATYKLVPVALLTYLDYIHQRLANFVIETGTKVEVPNNGDHHHVPIQVLNRSRR
jgi:hypothetical protein